MDLWVVAAVAVAGYVAKYWQQITSRENGDSSEQPVSGDLVDWQSDSRKLFHQFRDSVLPLPRLGQKQSGREIYRLGGDDNETGMASTSGAGAGAGIDCNVLSLMNLSTCVSGMENSQEIGYGQKGSIRLSKPMNSLESCLAAPSYNENAGMEQYVYDSAALQVTSSGLWRDSGLEEKEIRRRMGSIQLPRRSKVSSATSRLSISSTKASDQGTAHHSQGSSNGLLIFFLGIAIGIMSTTDPNGKEKERLNEQLKQSEVLVQSNDEPEPFKSNGAEKVELMNKIEAELEAELEKLELTMNTARLQRISKLAELQICRAKRQPSGTSRTDILHPANYAVPPMELSLRLHDVIKSRLEARVMELEAALESDYRVSGRMLYSESQSSSTQGSSICSYEGSDSDHEISLELIHDNGHFQKVQNPDDKTLSWATSYKLSFEEEEEDDDEIERLLRQIVERTKQGSPMNLNVQKSLCSMDL